MNILKTYFILLTCMGLVHCTAMIRTWHYSGTPVQTPQLDVKITAAHITQKTAHVRFELKNTTGEELTITTNQLTLTLDDDKTTVPGKTAMALRALSGVQKQFFGKEDPKLPPGQTMEIQVAFRLANRDLRRHPSMTIALDGIIVNGSGLANQHITIKAPPDAPIGEDI